MLDNWFTKQRQKEDSKPQNRPYYGSNKPKKISQGVKRESTSENSNFTSIIMEKLNQLYSAQRTGIQSLKKSNDPRSEFQRDFDRIIFSSAFRRLQNKTQVFPLPGSVFVHNRLTHSLEVSSVGRSLGSLVGNYIVTEYGSELSPESANFYQYNLSNVIASACLCHDIGNPAFGHSGEDAIAAFFIQHEADLKPKFLEKEWYDLLHFEGNANAIRVLTHQQNGKSEGGLQLTFSTLASIAKYPCEAIARNKKYLHRKKFGFFQSQKEVFKKITDETAMLLEGEDPIVYKRHPFVWLVEAADDICYTIIDIEDAHRLGIISHDECLSVMYDLVLDLQLKDKQRVDTQLDKIKNKNAKISYLRSKVIGAMTALCLEGYKNNFEAIMTGDLSTALFDSITSESQALKKIIEFSVDKIYNNRNVVEIENAGYNVIYELLLHFIPSALKAKDTQRKFDKKALRLIPEQFSYPQGSDYQKTMGIIDYISGMTDNYATELYKRIKGIETGMRI
jgi:dGTPase